MLYASWGDAEMNGFFKENVIGLNPETQMPLTGVMGPFKQGKGRHPKDTATELWTVGLPFPPLPCDTH